MVGYFKLNTSLGDLLLVSGLLVEGEPLGHAFTQIVQQQVGGLRHDFLFAIWTFIVINNMKLK